MLTEEDRDFTASVSAVKRLVVQLAKERGARAEDVAILVETPPGEVAQVDFGYVGHVVDPAFGRPRKGWLFVMVLGCSRHMFCKVVFDQSTETWLRLHVEAFACPGPHFATVIDATLGDADAVFALLLYHLHGSERTPPTRWCFSATARHGFGTARRSSSMT